MMKEGDMKAVYVMGEKSPDSKINLDDYILYLTEDEEVVKSKDPRIEKRLKELEEEANKKKR
jgi:hypothetical protein